MVKEWVYPDSIWTFYNEYFAEYQINGSLGTVGGDGANGGVGGFGGKAGQYEIIGLKEVQPEFKIIHKEGTSKALVRIINSHLTERSGSGTDKLKDREKFAFVCCNQMPNKSNDSHYLVLSMINFPPKSLELD